MPVPMTVEGAGLGAVAAAASLSRAGHPVVAPDLSEAVAGGPTLVLNEKTLWMIGNLFGPELLSGIVADGIAIRHRRLRWHSDRFENLPEKSLSVDAARLASRLGRTIPAAGDGPCLTVRARGRRANPGIAARPLAAYVWDLPVSSDGHLDWCATMTVGQGWAALAPAPLGGINLQVYLTCGAEPEARTNGAEVLDYLGLDAGLMLGNPPRRLDASARLGTLWQKAGCSVGDEALALDPLVGDGVGHTIRAALWVSSLLVAGDLSDHMRREVYRRRMMDVFRQHQEICARYYRHLDQSIAVSTETG
ncbi:hypothetical protein [uncultured Roseibium sp.]|uniref:hypothetical protein n=1 Tax=uncultured Roseibium sp. TaxID=1936171 RepID=UPI0026340E64|nr:hypothetical protein [uncultured Roseibium sp.]